MKTTAAVIALSSLSTLACADVSDDLKFCGARESAPERLACFEAVTRGASKPSSALPAVHAVAPRDARASIPTKGPSLDPPPSRNPFDGYYAAIGGGYGVATGPDSANAFSRNSFVQSFFSPSALHGANAGALIGRNVALGWGVVGFELSGRWSDEKFEQSQTQTFNSNFLNGSISQGYSYKNDAGIHAAIRAGVTLEDILVFAKLGAGATHISEAFSSDETRLRICSATDGFGNCTSFGSPGSFYRTSYDAWLPSVLFGLGVEKNWGQFFARLSADFEAFNHTSTNLAAGSFSGSSATDHITWTTRGTAMIGVRF
jgi:hypothetical protein